MSTDLEDGMAWSVHIAAGNGWVLRFGTTVVVARAVDARQEEFVEELRAELEAAVHSSAQGRGRTDARRLAGLVAQAEDAEVPSVALASVTPQGLIVLLVGDAEAEVVTQDGDPQHWSGRDASTWVDRLVPLPVASVTLSVQSVGAPDLRTDLRAGVVRGGGALLAPPSSTPSPTSSLHPAEPAKTTSTTSALPVPPETPTTAPVVSTPADPTASLEDVTREEPAPVDQRSPIPPLPVAAGLGEGHDYVVGLLDDPFPREQATPLPVDDAGPTPVRPPTEVDGILCSRGHFNDPSGVYCASCGIGMVQQTHNLVPGLRPPLGVLVLDDGSVFPLDGEYIVGREPFGAEDVVHGLALPLALDDPEQTMSRVHARFKLVGWSVHIVDLDSANGTFVAMSDSDVWERLPAHRPSALLPGTRMRFGGREAVFDSHRRR